MKRPELNAEGRNAARDIVSIVLLAQRAGERAHYLPEGTGALLVLVVGGNRDRSQRFDDVRLTTLQPEATPNQYRP